MEEYTLKVKLVSPALTASGEGFGAIIDTDIVFDETGLPYIPAKRIKGCLLDSASEVEEMFSKSEITCPLFSTVISTQLLTRSMHSAELPFSSPDAALFSTTSFSGFSLPLKSAIRTVPL